LRSVREYCAGGESGMTTIRASVRPEDLSQVPAGSERIPEAGIL